MNALDTAALRAAAEQTAETFGPDARMIGVTAGEVLAVFAERDRLLDRLAAAERDHADAIVRQRIAEKAAAERIDAEVRAERLAAALDAAHDLIEAVGCSPDNGHSYWGLRDAALAAEPAGEREGGEHE